MAVHAAKMGRIIRKAVGRKDEKVIRFQENPMESKQRSDNGIEDRGTSKLRNSPWDLGYRKAT